MAERPPNPAAPSKQRSSLCWWALETKAHSRAIPRSGRSDAAGSQVLWEEPPSPLAFHRGCRLRPPVTGWVPSCRTVGLLWWYVESSKRLSSFRTTVSSSGKGAFPMYVDRLAHRGTPRIIRIHLRSKRKRCSIFDLGIPPPHAAAP